MASIMAAGTTEGTSTSSSLSTSSLLSTVSNNPEKTDHSAAFHIPTVRSCTYKPAHPTPTCNLHSSIIIPLTYSIGSESPSKSSSLNSKSSSTTHNKPIIMSYLSFSLINLQTQFPPHIPQILLPNIANCNTTSSLLT